MKLRIDARLANLTLLLLALPLSIARRDEAAPLAETIALAYAILLPYLIDRLPE